MFIWELEEQLPLVEAGIMALAIILDKQVMVVAITALVEVKEVLVQ
jgi:hypothetical protein